MGRRSMTSHGRRKIEIKKIQSEDARHVCFSKRKSGIFAKASDISTLCGADVALLIYSPAGNPYSFGSPAMQPIVDRFLSGAAGGMSQTAAVQPPAAFANPNSTGVQQLNLQFMDLARKLDASKERKVKLRERLDASVLSEEWAWANSIDNLGFDQLDRLKDGFEWLKGNADARIKEILSSGHKMPPPPQLLLADGGAPPPPPPPQVAPPSSFPLWAFNSVHLANQFVEPGHPFPIHLAANRFAYLHDRVDGF